MVVAAPERARLVSVFGGNNVSPSMEQKRDSMLSRALADPSEAVAGAAAIAVWNLRSMRHLPAVVKLLQQPSSNVRMIAAQAIATFGAEARGYLADIERALVAEQDESVRRTLEAALAAVGGK